MSAKDKVSAADAMKMQTQAAKVSSGSTAEQTQSGPNWRKGNFKNGDESYADEQAEQDRDRKQAQQTS